MDTKKYAMIAVVASMVMLSAASMALADTAGTSVSATITPVATTVMLPAPAGSKATVLDIGADGNVLLRGTIDAVGTANLTVKSWGGDWTVNIPSSAKLMPASDMTQFAVGDFVGVQGSVDSGSSWTVDATLVRDWTVKEQVQANKAAVQTLKASAAKDWQGIISNISADGTSFTLTVSGTAYTVNVVSGAKVLNQKFMTTAFSNIKSGDTVRVWGPSSDATITASVVRDISITQ